MSCTFAIRVLIGAVLSLFLLGHASAQLAPPPTEEQLKSAGATQIQNEEITQLLKNQTLEHTNLLTGQSIPIFYRKDGRRFVGLGSGVRETKWWVKDNMRCEDSVSGRGSTCQKIYRQSDNYRICTAGETQCPWLVQAEPGDTRKLAR